MTKGRVRIGGCISEVASRYQMDRQKNTAHIISVVNKSISINVSVGSWQTVMSELYLIYINKMHAHLLPSTRVRVFFFLH